MQIIYAGRLEHLRGRRVVRIEERPAQDTYKSLIEEEEHGEVEVEFETGFRKNVLLEELNPVEEPQRVTYPIKWRVR